MNTHLHQHHLTGMHMSRLRKATALLASALMTAGLMAQAVEPAKPEETAKPATPPPAPAAPAAESSQDEVILLSPFEVSANSDVGYIATETLAGGRFRSEFKNVSASVNVMTSEFLNDIGANGLEEALKYSVNIESEKEFINPATQNQPGLTSNPYSPDGGTRARGLGRASTTLNLFETTVPIDNYNTERLTFVGGANAILFGNGLPGGSVDATTKRAKLNTDSYKVVARIDDEGGWRAELDTNQVLIKRKLGARFAVMRQNQDLALKPSYDKQARYYGTLNFQPVRWLSIRASYEDVDIKRQPIRNVMVQDKVSPFLNYLKTTNPTEYDNFMRTGVLSPAFGFNNGAVNSALNLATGTGATGAIATAVNSPNFITPRVIQPGLTYPANPTIAQINTTNTNFNNTKSAAFTTALALNPLFQNTAIIGTVNTANPVLVLGSNGTTPAVTSWNNTVVVTSPRVLSQYGSPGGIADGVDWTVGTIADPGINFPLVNIYGNGLQNRIKASIRNFAVELNPTRDLAFEYAYNEERFRQTFIEYMNYGNSELNIDLNLYLPVSATTTPARTTPDNPNFGRYFLGSTAGNNIGTNGSDNLRKEHRFTASYQLDFTKNRNWSRWLGKHNLVGLLSEQSNRRFEQNSQARIISNNVFTPINTLNQPIGANYVLNDVSRTLQIRQYIDNPNANPNGNFSVNIDQFDPWAGGVVGKDSAGNDVVLATAVTPWGTTQPIGNGRRKTDTWVLATQSSFLKDRLIVTYGLRKDKNTFTPWINNSSAPFAPRYDATLNGGQGGYIFPGAVNNGSTGLTLTNAPYQPYTDFNAGSDYRLLEAPTRAIYEEPTSRLAGIVVHATKWLSFIYNDSTSAYPADFSRRNLDGSAVSIDDGYTKEYGVSVSFSDKLSARLIRYEGERTGALSSNYRDNSGFDQRSIRDQQYHIEKTYFLNFPAAPTGAFAETPESYRVQVRSQPFPATPSNLDFRTGNSVPLPALRDQFDVFADRSGEGYELTITANPTPSIRTSLTAAQNEVVEKNIGSMWYDFLRERAPSWAAISSTQLYNTTGGTPITQAGGGQMWTVSQYMARYVVPSLLYIKQIDGVANPLERKYRVNLTGTYSFQQGRLKGLYVGAGVQWRSAPAIGFFTRPAAQAELDALGVNFAPFPDVNVNTVRVADLTRQIRGQELLTGDAWIGYNTKIWDNKVKMKVQLNASNLVREKDLLTQRAYGYLGSDLSSTADDQVIITSFLSPDPRIYRLTTTFEF